MQHDALTTGLRAYKRKYYLSRTLRGSLLGLALLLAGYLVVSTLGYLGNLPSLVRGLLFWGYVGLLVWVLVWLVGRPLLRLLAVAQPMSDAEAARQIGQYFPQVGDKLLNALQLRQLSAQENSLLAASIAQKTAQVSVVPFASAIRLGENRRHLRLVLPPVALLVLGLLFIPQLFTEGTQRIVRYQQQFVPQAPFRFVLLSPQLQAFAGEDFTLKLKLEGDARPSAVYVNSKGRKKLMVAQGDTLVYTFSQLQVSEDFQFEAAGFSSQPYTLRVLQRPSLQQLRVLLRYPSYLGKKPETLTNAGSMTVPAGTQAQWQVQGSAADSLLVRWGQGPSRAVQGRNGQFTFGQQLLQTTDLSLQLANQAARMKEPLAYRIEVIPDRYPTISAEQFQDSSLFNYLIVGGSLADDYGLSRLELAYSTTGPQGTFVRQRLRLPGTAAAQNFLHQWQLDSLKLQPGQALHYYLTVWDNDGVQGPKASRTPLLTMQLPTLAQLRQQAQQQAESTQASARQSLQQSKELDKQVKKLAEQLKTKRSLDFEDRKKLEQLTQQHQELKKNIEQLNSQMEKQQEQTERLDQPSAELKEKMEQLQQLMADLLDEETKKLYEKLQQLLQEKSPNIEQVQQVMEKLENKEELLNKELDRALEMFKQLKVEQKMEQATSQLEKLAEEQQKLAEETQQRKDKADNADLQQRQDELNKAMEEAKDDLKKLQEMNKELEDPNALPQDLEQQAEEASEEQEKSSQSLDKKQNKKASESQKEAASKMKQMAKSMKEAMEQGQQDQQEENAEDLRMILENLLRLSFDQEELMKNFRGVNQADPRYVDLGQKQLKLRDDARIIEDSLNALARRVVAIQSFVTREVASMKDYMDQSVEAIRSRRQGVAAGKQQLAMTSMNNLALMLSDALNQMQQQMAQAKSGTGKGKPKNKPGKGASGMSKLQQQLSKQIEQLQKSGKQGRALSEELSRLAGEQQALRRALQEMEKGNPSGQKQGKPGTEGGSKPGDNGKLKQLMEENERDLVNKRLTQQTIMRQREIMTRLLEAENSLREREYEEKRESRTAKELAPSLPPSFEKYLKQKQQQVEMLQTLPPGLAPFYKQEANRYLQAISAPSAP